MGSKDGVIIEVKSSIALSTQMMQFLSLLQMDTEQLDRFLHRKALENPMIELVPPKDDFAKDIHFRNIDGRADAGSDGTEFIPDSRTTEDNPSMTWFLREQLERHVIRDAKVRKCCYMIIESLNEDGFLEPEDRQRISRIGKAETEKALAIIRSLEPAGIAADDVRSSLLLQLTRVHGDTSLAQKIVEGNMELLGTGRLDRLMKKLVCSAEELRDAAELIRSLDPFPGRQFARQKQTVFVRPDAQVFPGEDGKPEIFLNETSNIQIRLNTEYEELLRQTNDRKTAEYLREKKEEAGWLKRSLWQRSCTYQLCLRKIVAWQEAFFCDRNESLRPMRLCDIAAETGLHISTVSRTIRSSYLLCSRGSVPVRSLFSTALGSAEHICSADYVKRGIREMIAEENPNKPLSDQQISTILAQRQIKVSRRTIAKYRTELGIPATDRRRGRNRTR